MFFADPVVSKTPPAVDVAPLSLKEPLKFRTDMKAEDVTGTKMRPFVKPCVQVIPENRKTENDTIFTRVRKKTIFAQLWPTVS